MIKKQDAYYSVKISEEDSKCLKFYAGKNLLKLVVLPNGLSSGPWKFTKLTKPPIACLRIEGVIVAIYIDDIIVIGDTYEECLIGTIKTIKLFLKLGFIIHLEKKLLTTFIRNNLSKSCFQFRGNVGYNYQWKKRKNSWVLKSLLKKVALQ